MKRQANNPRKTDSGPAVFWPKNWLQVILGILFALTPHQAAMAQELSASQLKQAARRSFEQGESAKAREHLTMLVTRFRQSAGRDSYARSRRLAEVSHEYLRAAELKEAMNVLAEAVDLNLSPMAGRYNGLASAAGGLHRRLAALDANKRYDVLHAWSMPAESRRTVRVLSSITPTHAPPPVFARALGERPRRDSFNLPEIGEVRGLFSTAWELVNAADDAGRLRQLTAEVAKLVEDDVPNAQFLATVIKIVDAKREDEELRRDLRDFASKNVNEDLVIAAACLTHEWLQPVGEEIFKTNLEQAHVRSSPRTRPFLRSAHATAIRKRYLDVSPGVGTSSNVDLWILSSGQEAARNAQGASRSIWLSHEDHILHLAGPGNDYLFFQYPLTGEFEFSCDAQIGGRGGTDGCIGYGGLGYEFRAARQLLRVRDANHSQVAELPCPFVANSVLATFNKFSLKSTTSGVTISCNRHPIWTDAPTDEASPWLALRCDGADAPVFRNVKITGDPVILREVKMSESLRGWAGSYYGERVALDRSGQEHDGARVLREDVPAQNDAAWFLKDGVLHGAKRESVDGQSRLYYVRPLLDGESISYEFLYEPDKLEVHPALGRIAFLIEPSGVRLHWTTDGDLEWTGLAEDNAVVEPLNRRGPRLLPLVSGEWNRVTLALNSDTLTLSLNETTVYTRKMERASERTFGFYHDKNRSKVRVRNVVMRGDWPEKLTEPQLNNLAAVKSDKSNSDRRVLGAIFDDRHVHGSVLAVHARASAMPLAQRYKWLSEWVLPNEDHQTLRMALDFTPSNPSPPVAENDVPTTGSRVMTGGNPVVPALDLVACAKELDRLKALQARVESFAPSSAQQRRARVSMLALIAMARADFTSAKLHLEELAELVHSSDHTSFPDRWPETLAISQAAKFPETRDAAREMASHIATSQIWRSRPSGSDAWNQHMRALENQLQYVTWRNDDSSRGQPLVNWVPASRDSARARGQGLPRARWKVSAPATVENVVSHEDDFLFYRIPLQGNFEVECEVSGYGRRGANLWVAGQWVGAVYLLQDYDFGDWRETQRLALVRKLHSADAWLRYRVVVRDGVCSTWFNGRKIHERPLADDHDPWVAIRSPADANGAVRNLRITGTPVIPAEVKLAAAPDLPGWLPASEDHRVGRTRKWHQLVDEGGGIRGIRTHDVAGSHREALIRYHRPMVEDGTIEYEFYYRDGKLVVHPALDRLTFMLQPSGVGVHWITDGPFDRTGLAPDNLFDEPDNRRSGKTLPLKSDAWNRLTLSLAGDVVDLSLNGELIYQRKLEPTNQRTFGLFHYSDRTEARVRNIVWRGDWPRELPRVAEQELAGEGTEVLDQALAKLPAAFHHNFAKDGMPSELFGMIAGRKNHFEKKRDGLRVACPGDNRNKYNHSTFAPHLSVKGDFDIIAEFEQFTPNPPAGGSGSIYIQAILDNEESNECLVLRRLLRHRATPQPIVRAQYVAQAVGGARRDRFSGLACEATAGRLRLARRGDTVYYLFAENDSPHFRLLSSQAATKDDLRAGGVRLVTQAQGEGATTIVWKSLTIRAQQLAGLAFENDKQTLTRLDKQRDALPQRFEHDFTKDLLTEDRFLQQGPALPRQPDERGLRITAPGTDNWNAAGVSAQIGLEGDFDIAASFDLLGLGRPKPNRNSTLYLQVEFADAKKTQVNLILVEHPNGDRQAYAQLRVTDAKGKHTYRRVRIDKVDAMDSMRIARRGRRIFYIYRSKGSAQEQILAERDLLDLPVPQTNIRVLLHTGGAGRQSDALLKQLRIHAEKIDSIPPDTSPHSIQNSFKQVEGDSWISLNLLRGENQFTLPARHLGHEFEVDSHLVTATGW